MSELWGVEKGLQIAGQERAQQQMQALAQQQGQQNLQKGAQELEAGRMSLDAAKSAEASQKQMMEMMKNQPPEMNLADKIEQMAAFSLKIGQPEKAKEYASTASSMRKNAQEIEAGQLTDHLKTLETGRGILEAVKAAPEAEREKAWAQGNQMFQMLTGKKSAFADMPYSPDALHHLEAQMGMKEQELKQKKAQAEVADKELETKERVARTAQIGAQQKLTEAQTLALGKQGVVIKDAELKPVADRIVAEYGQALSPEEARTIGRGIVERQRQLVTQNKLSSDEALNQAMAEEKATGQLKGVDPEFTKGPKATANNQAAAVSEIDDLISMIQKNPSVTGLQGVVGRGLETVKTATGKGDQSIPANEFQTAMEVLLMRLPKITGANREAQGRVDRVASALKLGVTGPIAIGKLEELKKVLAGGEQAKPGAASDTGPKEGEQRTAYDKAGTPVPLVFKGGKWTKK